MQKLIANYIDRFVNRFDIYNEQYTGKRFGYTKRTGEVNASLIERHLQQDITISLQALSVEQTCKWICWDSDHADGQIERLQKLLASYGWRTLREGVREGRDGHLWLMFSAPLPAATAIYFGNVYSRAAGLKEIEFFPKQATAAVGSAMRAPLGLHRKPGGESVGLFIDCKSEDVADQLRWFALQRPNDAETVANCVEVWQRMDRKIVPIRTERRRRWSGSANILEMIPASELKRCGREYYTQCPACAEVGMDSHRDNLRINPDGKFCCVEAGIAETHKARDIFRALQRRSS